MNGEIDSTNMTRKELAAFMKRSPRWVDKLMSEGKGPRGFKIRGIWLFRRVEVEEWLEGHEVEKPKKQGG